MKQHFYLKLKKCTNIIEQVWSKQCVTKLRLLFWEFDNQLGKTIIHGDLVFVKVTLFTI